jgi:hypothetical protein
MWRRARMTRACERAYVARLMPEHVHGHAPHELAEKGNAVSGRERVVEFAAVLLLSVATVCIAWSGYQAAKWSGLQASHYAQASTARAVANRASTLGGQERIQDLLNFNRWLEVTTEDKTNLAQLYERRFRPEFVPAFRAWSAQDPLNNAAAIETPLLMPQYKLASLKKADALERVGNSQFEQAKAATENADAYIFGTVSFAAVLFFAGISMRFNMVPIRLTVLSLSAIFLAYGAVHLANLPTL